MPSFLSSEEDISGPIKSIPMKHKKYKEKDPIADNLVNEAALAYKLPYLKVIKPDVSLYAIEQARKGIHMKDYVALASLMGMTQIEMAMVINISLRTLQRYSEAHVLDADTSSKVLQLMALNERGVDVFNNQLSFNKWLKSPVRELEGSTPLSYLDTSLGFQILDQILGRIEHGIFA